MKGIFKTFALLCMGLFAVACVEENFEKEPFDTTPGNDIKFSVEAKVADGAAETKTEYGDNDGQYIEVNWSTNDKITIASPEANGTTIAHYDIGFVEDEGGKYSGSHAATVTKRGGVGLQWSESDTYTFYGMYPMLDKDEDEDFNGTSELIEGTNGAPAVLKGFLPVTQKPKHIRTVGNSYIIDPDMRYAYMVAYDEYDRKATDADGNPEAISLPFKSLSTVLQFQLKAASFTNQNVDQIKINSISIYSEKGNPICGPFKYTYPTSLEEKGTSVFDTESSGGVSSSSFSRITMDFAQMGAEIILGTDDSFDVTFFLLPIVNFSKAVEDLKLQIFYEVGDNGNVNFMTAKLGVDIQASRKYYFKNVTMKSIDTSVDGSQWISALAENIYISQLSIPVAGNAFTYFYDGSDKQYFMQQTENYMDLWNKGVRGFEFCTAIGWDQRNNTGDYTSNGEGAGTLENEYFVCNGNEIFATNNNGAPTFGQAFRSLAEMLDEEKYPQYKNECLFVIATYKSFGGDGGYRPHIFLSDLDKFIEDNSFIKSKLVKLDPGSTVKTLRGKIAIIVRLEDDEYVDYAPTTSMSEIQNAVANLKNKDLLTIVKNWGSSADCWDRRFGADYARQMVFGQGGPYVEDFLYGVSSNSSTFQAASGYSSVSGAFKNGYPTQNQFNCLFDTYTTGQKVHIHEWARVIPTDLGGVQLYTNSNTNGLYLWVRWPESITQKKENIDYTFKAASGAKGGSTDNTLFINSLSGFYASNTLENSVAKNYKTSILPYAGEYSFRTNWFTTRKLSCDHAGNGGDIAGLAADLNVYFWEKMKSVDGTTDQGPLGFVMMDYIGSSATAYSSSPLVGTTGHVTAAEASKAANELPNMILMNNFKFPLAQLQSTPPQQTSYDAKYVDGGEAISFE